MTYKLSTDLSNTTNIAKLCLDNLFSKATDCIAYCVNENFASKETITAVDIGIGVLNIKIIEDKILYKFIPSAELESKISDSVNNGHNPLIYKLEASFAERVKSTYKGLY